MRNGFIKELFIIALLFVVIMFIIGILVYDFIPTNKVVPQAIEYTADSTVTATLQEITADLASQSTTTDSSSNYDETESLLKSYSIGKSDLSNYKSKNAFESGKPDPFSEYTEPDANTAANTVANTTGNNATTNTSKGNSNTSGTFFEKPNLK